MKTKDFLHQLDHRKVVVAIQKAEQKTSGEIRVFVSRKHIEAPVTVAQHHFLRMGMTLTRERNAILIFVASLAFEGNRTRELITLRFALAFLGIAGGILGLLDLFSKRKKAKPKPPSDNSTQ